MIQEALLRSYRDEFTRHAALTDEEQRRRRAIAAQEQKLREEKEVRDSREAHLHAILVVELASPAEIAAFTVRLDSYDAATVEAMIANEEALAKVREDVKIMLDKAYMLDDGRRVFKTEDGTRIFDEQGQEVTEVNADIRRYVLRGAEGTLGCQLPQSLGDPHQNGGRFLRPAPAGSDPFDPSARPRPIVSAPTRGISPARTG